MNIIAGHSLPAITVEEQYNLGKVCSWVNPSPNHVHVSVL